MNGIPPHVGIILVDHGSRFEEANVLLEEVARVYQRASGAAIVEPAHMELAEPTIAQAFATCVARGAREIVVHPYFLAPGRHSSQDIPRITAAAAAPFPDVPYRLTEALGLDDRMAEVIHRRVVEALERGDRA